MLQMILVGVAWNSPFSAGTLMLTHCNKPDEANEVKAVNDFILFSIAGAVRLASGYIYQVCGWLMLIYVCSGLMVAWFLLFTFIWFYAVPTTSADEKSLLDVSVNGSLLDMSVNGSRPPSWMGSGEYDDAPRTSDILRGGSTSVADRLMRSHDRRFSNDGSFNRGTEPLVALRSCCTKQQFQTIPTILTITTIRRWAVHLLPKTSKDKVW